MTPRTVDQVNVGLMLAALVAAFALPFECFLIAYAILGPLHYLTEISWLHERRFFLHGKRDWMWIAAVPLLAVLGGEFLIGRFHVPFLKSYTYAWASLGLFLAFALLLPQRMLRVAAAIVVTLVVLAYGASQGGRDGWYLASLYLTTILHVCVFTGAFMLYGALKSRSGWGYANVALFAVGCAVALLAPTGSPIGPSEYVTASYTNAFWSLNGELARILGLGTAPAGSTAVFATTADVFVSSGGVAVMRLIAFTYTYHYLNWFSKTSVIRWHQVSRWKLVSAVAIWIASVALYAHDYATGAKWLFALSYAHVLLEFPLNFVSFRGIGAELVARVRGGTASAPNT